MAGENGAGRGLLLYAESEHNADMYYAIHFLFGDPVIYLRHGEGDLLVCSNFERDEAQQHSSVRRVMGFDEAGHAEIVKGLPPERRYMARAELTRRLVRQHGLAALTITGEVPVWLVDHLRADGIDVVCDPHVLVGPRTRKSATEIAAIELAQRATERAARRAIDLIAAAEPRNGQLVLDGQPLTAEAVKAAIEASFLADNCVGELSIVACGADAASPHNRGSGPLRPNESIVLDLFPRHKGNRYFADMTRTVSKGTPSAAVQRMYDTTLRAQELALTMIRPGASGREIYEAVCRSYEEAGYPTSLRDGTMPQIGLIHGLGHGVGLEIHEAPSMGREDELLEEGQVVTVEPGLYDPAVGGVRIEDLVVVTANGCRNLTQFEKRLIV